MTTFMFCKFYFSHKTPKTISELSVTFYRLLKLNIQEDKQKQINKVYKSSPVTSVLSVTMGLDRILLFVGVLFSLVSLRDSRAITEIKIKTSCIPFSGTEGITGVWHELSLVTGALNCVSVLFLRISWNNKPRWSVKKFEISFERWILVCNFFSYFPILFILTTQYEGCDFCSMSATLITPTPDVSMSCPAREISWQL